MKICTICSTEKEITEFLRDKSAKDGYRNQCKSCLRDRNKGVWKSRSESYNRAMRKFRSTWKGVTQTSFQSSKLRAKKENLPHNITLQYLRDLIEDQEYKCAMTNEDLIIGDWWKGPSLDKKDPNLGYVIGNVQYVTQRINSSKSNLTVEQYIDLCESVLNVQRLSRNGVRLKAGAEARSTHYE